MLQQVGINRFIVKLFPGDHTNLPESARAHPSKPARLTPARLYRPWSRLKSGALKESRGEISSHKAMTVEATWPIRENRSRLADPKKAYGPQAWTVGAQAVSKSVRQYADAINFRADDRRCQGKLFFHKDKYIIVENKILTNGEI